PGDLDAAFVRHLAEQRAHERRLAAAVRADQAVDLAGRDREAHVLEDACAAERQVDTLEAYRGAASAHQLPAATARIAAVSVSRFSRISRSKRSAVYSPSDMCEKLYICTPVASRIVSASALAKYFSAKSTLTLACLILSIVSASWRAVGSTPWRGSMTATTLRPNSCMR